MIPLLVRSDERHAAVAAEVDRRLAGGESMVLAAHTLAETYAVLTSLPPPRRLSPRDARVLIERNFVQVAEQAVALDGPAYVELLGRMASQGVSGGRIYDAVIAACAERAGVATLLTFNVAHFRSLVGPRIEVVAPVG
jgi:predicted nucleic acid-binding protein